MDKRIAIIGFGQIGGSLGLALVAEGYEVIAVDIQAEVLASGLEIGAASQGTCDLIKGIEGAGLVVLATPVGAIPQVLQKITPHLSPGVIVTDVGSTKSGIVTLAGEVLPPEVSFIGGHPMAGTEQVGILGANAKLFVNAIYVLTPGAFCTTRALETLSSLVKCIGARPIIMDADRHDRAVGVISHLPHLLAVSLAHTAGELEEQQPGSLALAAGSFRDGTRVADSSPQMWQDICLANRDLILDSLQEFKRKLQILEEAVCCQNGSAIEDAFKAAARIREKASKDKALGINIVTTELIVDLPDEPGALGKLAQSLGAVNINIDTVESLPEGNNGVILGFRAAHAADQAKQVIATMGIGVEGRNTYGS
jgi:prephenate dehydrogenase